MTGTKMNGVAYRGAPLGLNDVMAGHVALMFADAGAVIGSIMGGKVRALGVTSTTRVPALPDTSDHRRGRRARLRCRRLDDDCVPEATPKPVIDRLPPNSRRSPQRRRSRR